MESLNQKIDIFFKAYQKRFNDVLQGKKLDLEATVNAFAEYFVEASPVGITGGKNDNVFKESIPKGYEFYKSIGTTSMIILSKEIIPLDELHTLVKVCWRSDYVKRNKEKAKYTIDFNVMYFLQHVKDELKIFAYITGDEMKVLKEHGLV